MIKQTIRLFTLFLSLTISHITWADTHKILANYTELLTALTNGNKVRTIMKLNKCTSDSNSIDSKNLIGGMNFTNFNAHQIIISGQQKKVVSTSINILVESTTKGPVYNYVRLRVFEDDSAEIFSEILDPRTYTSLTTASYFCRLSDGNDNNGIVLYDLSQT